MLKRVRVLPRLLLSGYRRLTRRLGFDDSERPTVVVPQDVVDPALAGLGRWQPGDRVLPVLGLIQEPSGLPEQEVDDVGPGLRLAVVVRVAPLLICRFGSPDFFPQALHFIVEVSAAPTLLGQFFLLSGDLLRHRLQLGEILLPDRSRLRHRDPRSVKSQRGRRNVGFMPRIVAGQPVHHVEELGDGPDRVFALHWLGRVHRQVSLPANDVHLHSQRRANQVHQRRLVDHRAEVTAIWLAQGVVRLVEPVQCQLNRTPRVEARRPGVGNRQPFGSHRLAIQLRPLCLQEPKVAHDPILTQQ